MSVDRPAAGLDPRGAGRATLLPGVVHLILLATGLFLIVAP